MTFEEVNFDLDDKNLFLVDDLKLKAEAIRHSILPKLEIITNHTISKINGILKTNVLELFTVLKFPHYRKTRAKEFAIDYTCSESGLGGKRNVTLWKDMRKKDGHPPMIVPFSLTYRLDESGLKFYFYTKRYNLTMKDNGLFYNFHLKYAEDISNILNESEVTLLKHYEFENKKYKLFSWSPLKDYLKWQMQNELWDLRYQSKTFTYPISNSDIVELAVDFLIFYPVYESYLCFAAGKPSSFAQQIQRLRQWHIQMIEWENSLPEGLSTDKKNLSQKIDLKKLAEIKIKVMPALRWQVLQRDNWKCVSCGRSSLHEIVLHVDHVIPRSKGGPDHIDNYQTLCNICNIGKSNKDDTDLRKRKK